MTCLIPNCDRPQNNRGMCHRHANQWRYHIKLGRCTWEDLQAWGVALPPVKAGRPRSKLVNNILNKEPKP